MSFFGVTLAPRVLASKSLSKWIVPFSQWYTGISGYRKQGLLYDDLVQEEDPNVQRALSRLTDRQKYDRAYRIKRASQASVLHRPLPKDQWTKPEEDIRYLTPHIIEVLKEEQERKTWESLTVEK